MRSSLRSKDIPARAWVDSFGGRPTGRVEVVFRLPEDLPAGRPRLLLARREEVRLVFVY